MMMLLVFALASCKKTPEVNLKYVDVERDLVTVGTTTANIQCDYDYITTLKKAYLYYVEGTEETNMSSAEMRVVQASLYVELSGLKENTTYSYYYEFVNGFNSMRSALKSFKTEAAGGGEEPPTPPVIMLPTVITAAVTDITTNSAQCGGEVTNDGGAEVTERGICWSRNANPSLNDNNVVVGTGIGAFTATMSGLEANTTYHVRAYAINEKGIAFGLDKEFATLSGGGGGVPEGAINGLFTINENGDQVYFSQGNLQYQASTNTWRFAENQWDYVGTQTPGWLSHGVCGGNVEGSDNYNISENYDGWIDLFNWGTSGYDHGANYYHPWNIGGNIDDYYAYGCNSCSLFDYDGKADWGYNAISNGGDAENLWRTMTVEEWDYILYNRNVDSEIRFAKAIVNGVNGLIILPDGWQSYIYSLNNVNQTDIIYDANIVAESVWRETLQYNGAVFLPAAGFRQRLDNDIDDTSVCGRYWSSTRNSIAKAYTTDFGTGWMYTGGVEFWFSRSVRLVQDYNPKNKAK